MEHLLEEKFKDRYVSQYELVSFSTVPYPLSYLSSPFSSLYSLYSLFPPLKYPSTPPFFLSGKRYSISQQTGITNKKILAELTKNADRDINKIDLALADKLIKEYLNK